MIFTHPRCLQCFPIQKNSNQRPSTLKLPPLISQVSLSSSSLEPLFKICKETLYSSLQLSKSCNVLPNRDTVGAYDPKYDQPYPENVSSKPKIVSRFFKIMSRLNTLQNMLSTLRNSDTLHKSCHGFKFFQLYNLKA